MKALHKVLLPKGWRRALRKAAYFGKLFRCPVCGSWVRELLPGGRQFPVLQELDVIGAGPRPRDVCPVCFSNCRTRLVQHYLATENDLADPRRPVRVLHVAPERGIAEWLGVRSWVTYLAGDLSPERYDFVPALKLDVTRLQFDDAHFDLVICNHVLEHVPDDGLAMRELHRVLKPGGRAILQVPISTVLPATREDPSVTDPGERERRFGQSDHVRIYARDYQDRLSRAGFVVEVIDPATWWGRDTLTRLRLDPRERLYVGRRQGG